MTELQSARRKAKSSRLLKNGAKTSVQLKALLREVSRLLTDIYSICVISELALQRQNAGHDLVAILRLHVSEPLGRQIENLDSLVVELGGVADEAGP